MERICEKRHYHSLLLGELPQNIMIRNLIINIGRQGKIGDNFPDITETYDPWKSNTFAERRTWFKHLYNRVWTQNPGHPMYVKGQPNQCELCHQAPINGAHIRRGCKHKTREAMYTQIHNLNVNTQHRPCNEERKRRRQIR